MKHLNWWVINNRFILFCFISYISISCNNDNTSKQSDNKIVITKSDTIEVPATLIIGTSLDDKSVISGSSIITKKDKFLTYLLHKKTNFDAPKITIRFYKIVNEGLQVLKSYDVNISPSSNALKNRIPTYILYRLYGKGDFLFEFILKDKTLANQKFILK